MLLVEREFSPEAVEVPKRPPYIVFVRRTITDRCQLFIDSGHEYGKPDVPTQSCLIEAEIENVSSWANSPGRMSVSWTYPFEDDETCWEHGFVKPIYEKFHAHFENHIDQVAKELADEGYKIIEWPSTEEGVRDYYANMDQLFTKEGIPEEPPPGARQVCPNWSVTPCLPFLRKGCKYRGCIHQYRCRRSV